MAEEIFNKFLVIKRQWINENLTPEEFNTLMSLIEKCRVKQHSYYVVNTDEPYADKIKQLILKEESKKGIYNDR